MTFIVIFCLVVLTMMIIGLGAAGWCQMLAKFLLRIDLEESVLSNIALYAWLAWIVHLIVVVLSVIQDHPIYPSFVDYAAKQFYVFVFCLIGTIYYTKNN